MKKDLVSVILLLLGSAGCNSDDNKGKVKEPEASVAQTVQSDTLVTVYDGVQPCKGCKAIATEIVFARRLQDTIGRFRLTEAYINKKDSAYKRYFGVGNYKILPAANGDVKGVALYNMVLDDQSRGYLYLMADSVTLLRVDDKGKPVRGDEALTLKRKG